MGWQIVEATPGDGVPQPTDGGGVGETWDYLRFLFDSLRDNLSLAGLLALLQQLGTLLLAFLRTPWALVLGLLLLGLAAWRWWRRARKQNGKPIPVPAEVAAMRRLLAQVDRDVAKLDRKRTPDETLHAFAARVEEVSPPHAAWYRAYADARYRPDLDADTIARLRDEVPAPPAAGLKARAG